MNALAAWTIMALLCLQEEKQSVRIQVPDSDALEVSLPKTWDAKIVQPRPQIPPTLRAVAADRAPLSLQMTFIPLKPGKLSTSEEIKEAVRKGNAQFIEGSIEKKMEMLQLESKSGEGYYCSFTDSSLVDVKPIPEGKFLKVLSGIFVINRTAIPFTILSNPSAADQVKAALEAVAKTVKPEGK
ncbi:MAG TPA: hypothetical protein VNM14_09775 [Planctomycetota bacterium]|jgi:hypothetical protein|nr:hypothetical protein [Planctomycetota bacterium]